ncbi:uncharacterized protein UHOD_11213 [Ustilago sp. UG-2017b]|nr:uncharacterized protein UHOD_11213 [Ustilago sp. UG-2017b]
MTGKLCRISDSRYANAYCDSRSGQYITYPNEQSWRKCEIELGLTCFHYELRSVGIPDKPWKLRRIFDCSQCSLLSTDASSIENATLTLVV